MSERVDVILDDGTGKEFDKRLWEKDILQDGGDLTLVTKNNATVAGKPAVMLTFSVEVDGKLRQAQTVTTVAALLTATAALKEKYSW